jgi:hypothetical protein
MGAGLLRGSYRSGWRLPRGNGTSNAESGATPPGQRDPRLVSHRRSWFSGSVLVAVVLVVSIHWRERAVLSGGFILSPSATLRVADLAPRVKVEHTTV